MAGLTWYSSDSPQLLIKQPGKTDPLTKRAGTHQIPVVRFPLSGWIVADSTPIFKHIASNTLYNNPNSVNLYGKPGLTRVVVALMEEYFDEWVARLAVHERWQKMDSTETTAPEMVAEMLGSSIDRTSQEFQVALQTLKSWGPRACRATGVSSTIQQHEADKELLRIFTAFETHLKQTSKSFILGNAPCAADASLYGGLNAHFLKDVAPRNILSSLSMVKEWEKNALTKHFMNCSANDSTNQITISTVEEIPYFIDFILKEMTNQGGYVAFCVGNREALLQKRKHFETRIYGETVSFLTRPYPEISRQMLIEFCNESCTTVRDKNELEKLMNKYNLQPLLVDDGQNKMSYL
jgi:glutathione S-transferase